MQRRPPNAPPVRCKACGRRTANPRRGRCDGCYQRTYHGRELGPSCEACGNGDRRVLTRKTLRSGLHTLCGNCGTLAGRRPLTLGELQAEIRPGGDRRQSDRRQGPRRAFVDRRFELAFPDLEQRETDRRA